MKRLVLFSNPSGLRVDFHFKEDTVVKVDTSL